MISVQEKLIELGYQHIHFESQKDFFQNLREQLVKLNDRHSLELTKQEWNDLLNHHFLNSGYSWWEKLKKLQSNDYTYNLRKGNSFESIKLIDKTNFKNNSFQFVTNHYDDNINVHNNRFRVTILINGFPLVHLEITDPSQTVKESFESMTNTWKKDCLLNYGGALDYLKIFIISNQTETKYFSSSVWNNFFLTKGTFWRKNVADPFRFTTHWTESFNNKAISKIIPFVSSFLTLENLWNMVLNFSVLVHSTREEEIDLKVMRPYQVHATKAVLRKIRGAIREGDKASGYIWHATGSGKTLTSFKVCQLAMQMPGVQKVLFVVDRKDLDYQTKKNYSEYEYYEGTRSVQASSTFNLKKHLSDGRNKLIITTIQKFSECIKGKYDLFRDVEIFKKHMVIVFDECHRSQSGSMHKLIRRNCTNSHIFGFTGTPIFDEKAKKSMEDSDFETKPKLPSLRPTVTLFGEKLHSYTLFDAISDGNVLSFKVDYLDWKDKNKNKEIDLNTKEISLPEAWIKTTVDYVLKKFDFYTYRPPHDGGHNSLLTTSSIEKAKKYYSEFKKKNKSNKLKIAIIYSDVDQEKEEFNFDSEEFQEDDSSIYMEKTSLSDRDFLEKAIGDYNKLFFKSNVINNFQSYYDDVSQRLRSGEIDLLIVVNMFLTGFDAPKLSSLWIDRKLKKHNLVQAFSRTNRIFGERKKFGNIICFQTDESMVQDAFNQYVYLGERGEEAVINEVFAPPFEKALEQYKEKAENLRVYVENPEALEFEKDDDIAKFISDFDSFEEEEKNIQTYIAFEEEDRAFSEDQVEELRERRKSFWRKRIKKIEELEVKEESEEEEELSHEWTFEKNVVIDSGYLIGLQVIKANINETTSFVHIDELKKEIKERIDSSNIAHKDWSKKVMFEFIEFLAIHKDENNRNLPYFLSQRLEDELTSFANSENLNREKIIIQFANSLVSLEEFPIDLSDVMNECINYSDSLGMGEMVSKARKIRDKLQVLVQRYSEFRSYLIDWAQKHGVFIPEYQK